MEGRLILGDCMEAMKGLPDKSVDLIVTDPPYLIRGIQFDSGLFRTRKMGGEGSRYRELRDKGLDAGIPDCEAFLREACRAMRHVNMYVWCNKEQVKGYLDFFLGRESRKKVNWELIVWGKNDPPPFVGSHYLKDKELCLYFWEPGHGPRNVTCRTGRTVYLTNRNVADAKRFGHPTPKREDITTNLILNSSNPGDTVLDPFMGSGTVPAMAKRLGRGYIGMELDEGYFRTAERRVGDTTVGERLAGEQGKLL